MEVGTGNADARRSQPARRTAARLPLQQTGRAEARNWVSHRHRLPPEYPAGYRKAQRDIAEMHPLRVHRITPGVGARRPPLSQPYQPPYGTGNPPTGHGSSTKGSTVTKVGTSPTPASRPYSPTTSSTRAIPSRKCRGGVIRLTTRYPSAGKS